MSELGDRFQALMRERGVGVEQMGRAAGIDTGTVQQILRGEIERPPDERLRAFAELFKVSFESLLELIPRELRESATPLIEARDQAGRKWRIRVIRAGLSGNGNFYSDAALREAAPLFEGVRVFVKDDKEHLTGAGKSFRNLIGRLDDVRFIEGRSRDRGELQATLEVLESASGVAAKLREAWEHGMTALFGFSIDAVGATRIATHGGRKVRLVTKLTEVKSVDLIVEPGAGGQIVNLIESRKGTQPMDFLSEDQIHTTIRESKLPAYAQQRLVGDFKDAEVSEEELREAIDKERKYLAKASDTGTVRGLGETSRIELIEGSAGEDGQEAGRFLRPERPLGHFHPRVLPGLHRRPELHRP